MVKETGGRRHAKVWAKLKGTTIVRWTGRGRFKSLESSIALLLKDAHVRARTWHSGGSVVVEGPEPTAVATMLRHMPGVSWIAVGMSAGSLNELGSVASGLAENYLRRVDRFSVLAEATGGAVPSDVAGVVASAALEAVKGARIDEQAPRVRLRAAFDGIRGAVGVEIMQGPGGAPTGTGDATCLVSGGKHSSVVAWMALLSGCSVRLLHAKVDDRSLREVARLYSELSNRADYSSLSLEVLEGGEATRALMDRARRSGGSVFGGFHPGCSSVPKALKGSVEAPLSLLTEEEFDGRLSELGLRGYDVKQDWSAGKSERATIRKFGGARADVSGVLDGLA